MDKILYYLMDKDGWYRNVVYVCGEPWCTKNADVKAAIRYTESEMLRAKDHLKRRKVRVYETVVPGKRKCDRFGKIKEK